MICFSRRTLSSAILFLASSFPSLSELFFEKMEGECALLCLFHLQNHSGSSHFGTQLASPGRENEKMPEKSEVQGIIGGGGVPSDPVFAMGWNETVFDKSEAAFARRRTRTA